MDTPALRNIERSNLKYELCPVCKLQQFTRMWTVAVVYFDNLGYE